MLTSKLKGCTNPLVVEYLGTVTSASNLTTYTFNNVDFGQPSASREIFVVVGWGTTTTTKTLNSATIGGVTASLESGAGNSASGVRCIRASVPTGTTGTISITMSGTCTNMGAGVYRVIRRNRNTGETDFSSAAAAGASSPISTTDLTINGRGFGLGYYGTSNDKVYSSNVFTINEYVTALSAESAWAVRMSYVNTSANSTTPTQSITFASGTSSYRNGYWTFDG